MDLITETRQFPIPFSRAAAMRQLMDHVDSGHTWWWTGTVSLDKAEAFLAKVLPLGVGLDDNRRTRARNPKPTKRDPNPIGRSTQLVIYPGPNPKTPEFLTWFLLSTSPVPGEHLVDYQEQRLAWNEYELIRWTRPTKIGGGEVWSWRLTAAAFEQHAQDFAAAGRHMNPFMLKKKLYGIRQRPGWGAFRQQALALFKTAKTAARIKGKRAQGFIDQMDWSLPPEYRSMRYWRQDEPVRLGDLLK